MEFKYCLRCNKIIKRLKKHKSVWNQIKFCCPECRIQYIKEEYLKNNKLKKCFTYHEIMVKKVNKKFKGKIINIQTRRDHENPDIITEEAHIEVEQLSHYHKFKKKYDKNRDNSKKHILYIFADERLKEFFDEIHYFE
jgi:uncharacterized membrane protein